MTQGERVREVRKSLGLTLEKFGEKIGIKKNSVSQIENGINNLTEQIAKSICREFGVNYTWLTTEQGYMFEDLTDQQKLLKYTGFLLKDKDSVIANAIQTLIVTYEQLDATSKATLEKIALQYIDNLKKSQ
ncbi:hypothetical protein C808_00054 [Lachnospiraceae bacterium M18-1]|nr:hypothetical protein C808_00054 [Lachnospiraceae bacterium M18-1]